MASEPKTLQEAVIYFADGKNCREYLVARRWPMALMSALRKQQRHYSLEKFNRWQCNSKIEEDPLSSLQRPEPSLKIRPSDWISGFGNVAHRLIARTAFPLTRFQPRSGHVSQKIHLVHAAADPA